MMPVISVPLLIGARNPTGLQANRHTSWTQAVKPFSICHPIARLHPGNSAKYVSLILILPDRPRYRWLYRCMHRSGTTSTTVLQLLVDMNSNTALALDKTNSHSSLVSGLFENEGPRSTPLLADGIWRGIDRWMCQCRMPISCWGLFEGPHK